MFGDLPPSSTVDGIILSAAHFKICAPTGVDPVNAILANELAEQIHALALHTYTEKEWNEYYADNTPLSPKCLGGSKATA